MSKKKIKAAASEPDTVSTHKITEKHQVRGVYVVGKNEGQKKAIDVIHEHEISVLYGIPGSGKTHLALSIGLAGLLQGKYDRLILTRPYVEAGERMGFLPGDFSTKIAPFMQPLMEIMGGAIGKTALTAFLEAGNIEVLPLAFMRGRSFNNTFVVADECQNCTTQQMRMLLTRIGRESKIVITGDTEQSDLYTRGEKNGLQDCIDRFKGKLPEMGFFEMTEDCCVRSPIVTKIEKIYRQGKPTNHG